MSAEIAGFFVSVLTVAALIVLLIGVLLMFMVHNRKTCASGISVLIVYGIPIVALRAYLLDSIAGWVALGLYLVMIVLGVILSSMLMVKFNKSRFSQYVRFI